jgi:hypothetical protein
MCQSVRTRPVDVYFNSQDLLEAKRNAALDSPEEIDASRDDSHHGLEISGTDNADPARDSLPIVKSDRPTPVHGRSTKGHKGNLARGELGQPIEAVDDSLYVLYPLRERKTMMLGANRSAVGIIERLAPLSNPVEADDGDRLAESFEGRHERYREREQGLFGSPPRGRNDHCRRPG